TPDNVRAYARGIASNAARQLVRRRMGRGAPRPSEVPYASDHAGDQNDPAEVAERKEIASLVDILPPHEAQAVRLWYFDWRKYDEISEALAVPRGSVGALLRRALGRLREWLE